METVRSDFRIVSLISIPMKGWVGAGPLGRGKGAALWERKRHPLGAKKGAFLNQKNPIKIGISGWRSGVHNKKPGVSGQLTS